MANEKSDDMVRKALPEFERPPLVEVALSVQFDEIPDLTCAHIGLLWKEYFSDHLEIKQLAPIEPVFEQLGVRPPLTKPQIELISGVPSARYWLINSQSHELIQIQPDRFVRNWRKSSSSDEYPRYEKHIKPSFKNDLSKFIEFLSKNGLGDIAPNQCEVTYINHLEFEGYSHDHISEMLNIVNPAQNENGELVFEDAKLHLRNVIRNNNGDFLGRLHINVEPAYRINDSNPIAVLTLTARGKPMGDGVEGVEKFLDLGRELIVNSFKSITTPKMHDIWRLI